MKRMMITAGLPSKALIGGLTAAALAVAPGTEAADPSYKHAGAGLTPQKVAKIAKRVFRTEIRALEPVGGGDTTVGHAETAGYAETAGHAATTGRASTAGHADMAGHANTAGRADTAARADTVGHASTAGHATTAGTAETAEVAGIAESANPMAYALISADGQVDAQRSQGISQADVVVGHVSIGQDGLYCFLGPSPVGIQVTDVVVGNETPTAIGAALGQHPMGGCPGGTKFFVKTAGKTAFFLSLVL
jgi:hypothetical protein